MRHNGRPNKQDATISAGEAAALERLIRIAQRDTGQSRRVADFLLAWWNADECGGFDLTDLWSVDTEIARDMLDIVKMIARHHDYPDTLGYRSQFEELVRLWRFKEGLTENCDNPELGIAGR